MKRRDFLGLLVGAAASWPLAARAQQSAVPVIGWLSPRSSDTDAQLLAVFRRGLNEYGFTEGQNAAIEYRWAEGQYDRLPALAADLVRRNVAAIVAISGEVSVPAARDMTATIPIVFAVATDPVRLGFVASLNRPGGNITGVTSSFIEAAPKRLGLLLELLPNATTIAVLANPAFLGGSATEMKEIEAAARAIGRRVIVLHAASDSDLDAAFASPGQVRPDALVVAVDPFFFSRAHRLLELAARHAIPTLYYRREFAAAGGLMSYGSNPDESYHLLGVYAGRILKGEKPADLPIWQPTKFEFVINLKTAKALGLEVPPMLLARADAVIE
jgi:putative ABC transport system substrate-binding protein